jgi:hypothetical protein
LSFDEEEATPMLEIADFLGWCFIPMLVCIGGLLAVIFGRLPLLSDRELVLSGWPARAYGLMLFVQLPAAIWVVITWPELKWETAVATNGMAFFTGGVLYALIRRVKRVNRRHEDDVRLHPGESGALTDGPRE